MLKSCWCWWVVVVHLDYNVSSGPFLSFGDWNWRWTKTRTLSFGDWNWRWTRTRIRAWQLPMSKIWIIPRKILPATRYIWNNRKFRWRLSKNSVQLFSYSDIHSPLSALYEMRKLAVLFMFSKWLIKGDGNDGEPGQFKNMLKWLQITYLWMVWD